MAPLLAGHARTWAKRRMLMLRYLLAPAILMALALCPCVRASAAQPRMEFVEVAKDGKGFALAPSGKKFTPWGFNYDHDRRPRLLEEYWEAEWSTVAEDFAEMRDLGANVVRIHLQLVKFMDAPDKPNAKSLEMLRRLITLAEQNGLYLDITGLACYRKKEAPAWYDALGESERWDVQARFWEAVAACGAGSPAVFCYDLMNEPVVPGGRREAGEWVAGDLAGFSYVQFITLDQAGRPRPEIARQWIARLKAAIRKHDPRHLITVGLVPWSVDRPGLTSGFVPREVAGDLDFLCVHLYPNEKKPEEDLETLKGFSVGKPLVIEEIFLMNCGADYLRKFIGESRQYACGWIGFYWGQTPAELRQSRDIGPALTAAWLEVFRKARPE